MYQSYTQIDPVQNFYCKLAINLFANNINWKLLKILKGKKETGKRKYWSQRNRKPIDIFYFNCAVWLLKVDHSKNCYYNQACKPFMIDYTLSL